MRYDAKYYHQLIISSLSWRQVMVTNVTSLLKTVKAVEDEATRGTRALEATIECIKQELTVRTLGVSQLRIFTSCQVFYNSIIV